MRPKDSQRKLQQTLRTDELHCHNHCPDYLALIFSVKELEMPPQRMIEFRIGRSQMALYWTERSFLSP